MQVLNNKQYEQIVTWTKSGKSFVIIDPILFVDKVLPVHFKAAKYSSFVRKLRRWRFTRNNEEEPVEFFHKLFQKGRVDLASTMTCHAGLSKARLAVSPKNETLQPRKSKGEPFTLSPKTSRHIYESDRISSHPMIGAPSWRKPEAIELEALRLKKCIESAAVSRRILLATLIQEEQAQRNTSFKRISGPYYGFLNLGRSTPRMPFYFHEQQNQLKTNALLEAIQASKSRSDTRVTSKLPYQKNTEGAMTA